MRGSWSWPELSRRRVIVFGVSQALLDIAIVAAVCQVAEGDAYLGHSHRQPRAGLKPPRYE